MRFSDRCMASSNEGTKERFMNIEREKMLAGKLYNALDPELVQERDRARDLCQILNSTREADRDLRRQLVITIFGKGGDTVSLQPPFYCDYGSNIELGERVFFNFNCIVLDVCKVVIGDYSQFGSAVQILTPLHPLNAELRRKEEYGAPVSIGSDVWVGSGAIILPGVTIGSRTVVGAGSVVSRSLPENVLAVGNPCRVVRAIK
jgi:maltose O-acetyltransferase